jgi:hypothetical protein
MGKIYIMGTTYLHLHDSIQRGVERRMQLSLPANGKIYEITNVNFKK